MKMDKIFKHRKISRDDFREKSQKRFNFLHMLSPNKKKDLDHKSFIAGEKVPKK